jgi:hypothetical protein
MGRDLSDRSAFKSLPSSLLDFTLFWVTFRHRRLETIFSHPLCIHLRNITINVVANMLSNAITKNTHRGVVELVLSHDCKTTVSYSENEK